MIPGDTIGNYKIIRLLGRGGMGEVYLAEDVRLGRQVAVKVISENLIQDLHVLSRFRREAPAAAALNHPNICAVYDVGESEGRPYIAMEYVEGITLQKRIAGDPLSIPEILDIAIQIADALNDARKKNIIHRDIKSSNILLTERNQVKLLDFGLAKLKIITTDLSEAPTTTQPGMILGTVEYMSPEQLRGEEVDHRSDIFSFGVVLYKMLTGRRPFSGQTVPETIDSILHQDPPAIARYNYKVPDALVRVVNKTLQKRRSDRYQSVEEVWIDLRQIRTETTEPIPFQKKRKRHVRWIVAAVVVLAALSSVFVFKTQEFKTQQLELHAIIDLVALPCKVYGSQELNYLTEAVPNSLSTLLARVQGLNTRVPPTSVEVDRIQGDLDKIARLYQVETFVMTSVSAQGDRLTLNVQVVEAPSRKVLWSDQYQGSLQNYIELTREAAEGIRKALRPTSSAIAVASAAGMTSSSGAELAFRQGKYYSLRYDNFRRPQDFEEALSAFKRALEMDPKLADAAAEIGALYNFRQSIAASQKDLPEIERWARRSLQINPRCGKGWAVLAALEFAPPTINLQKLLEFALKGASFAPKDASNHLILSLALHPVSINLGIKAAQEAQRLDPLYPYASLNVDRLIVLGRSDQAFRIVEDVLRSEPNLPMALFYKSLILSNLGRTEESAPIVAQLKRIVQEGRFDEDLLFVAELIYSLQARDYGRAEQLRRRISSTTDAAAILFYVDFAASMFMHHGKKDGTIEILKRGLEANMVPYDLLMMSPDLKPLQEDPQFEKIFSDSRSRFQQVLEILQQSKERGELPSYLNEPLSDLSEKYF